MNAILRDRLKAWEKRLRRQAAVRAAVWGSLGGAALAAVYVGGAKWFHWPHAEMVAAGVFVAVPAVAFLVRSARRIPLADVARAADRAAGTNDRFSTALELEGSEWAELVERDVTSAKMPGEKELFATRLPRVSRWSLVAAAVVAAILFLVPARNLPAVAVTPSDLKGLEAPPELASAAEDLRKLGAEDGNPELTDLGKALERIDEAWKDGKIDRKEALAQIGEVKEKIREAVEKSAARKEALAKMAEADASHDLGQRTASGDGADALGSAAARLGKDAGNDAKLADALENASKAAARDKELADALKKAADAARRGDRKAFEEAMKKAQERWNGLSKKGAEEAKKAAEASGKSGEGKAGKGLDPKLLKEMNKLLAKNGWNDKEVQDALDRLSELANKVGKDGESSAMTDAELREMIKKMQEMDQKELKELAEKLKHMTKEEFEKLAKQMTKDAKSASGKGSGDWIRKLNSKGDLALGKAGKASGKAEGKLSGRNGTGSGTDSGSSEDGGPGPGGGHGNPLAGSDRNRKPVEFHDEKVEVPVMPGDPGEAFADGGYTDPDEGTASLPFEKVIVKYRADMEKAMDDEAYPEEYRRAVRDYFDSLK